MTIAIRDHEPNRIILVRFDAVANCLEPEAAKYFWRISFVDGMLASGSDAYTLDDAEADALASLTSPMSWQALKFWSSRFFQIYNCEFQSVGAPGCDDLKVCCIDSSQWEVTTSSSTIIERLYLTFKITASVADLDA